MAKNLTFVTAAGLLVALLGCCSRSPQLAAAVTLRPSNTLEPQDFAIASEIAFAEETPGTSSGGQGGDGDRGEGRRTAAGSSGDEPESKKPKTGPMRPGPMTRAQAAGTMSARERYEESVKKATEGPRRSPRGHPSGGYGAPRAGTAARLREQAERRDREARDPRAGVPESQRAEQIQAEMHRRVQQGAGKSREELKAEMEKELLETTAETKERLDKDAERRARHVEREGKGKGWRALRAAAPLLPHAKGVVESQKGWYR